MSDYSGSHQERFDKALYLHYIEMRQEYDFKHTSKENFENTLLPLMGKLKSIGFDKQRVYRLADEKIVWYGSFNNIIGEVWNERDENGDYVESYWIRLSR